MKMKRRALGSVPPDLHAVAPPAVQAPLPILIWREIRRLVVLAFPITVALMATLLIGVVDTIMVAPLGTVPLAAISITMSFVIILYSGLYGFVSVISVRIAEAHGNGSPDALSRALRSGLAIACVTGTCAVLLMLAIRPVLPFLGQPEEVIDVLGGYWTAMSVIMIPFILFLTLKGLFDAMSQPWIGVGLAFLAVGLNVPANLVLIHGIGSWEGLGLTGAGLASLLSEVATLLIALIIWRRARFTAPARRVIHDLGAEMRLQVKEGATIAAGYMGEGGAYTVAILMIGWFGATALAATQIVTSVGNVIYMVPLGLSIAVSIRIGQAIGAGEIYRLQRIGIAALVTIISWMGVVMIGVFLLRGPISRGLSDDPEVVMLAMAMFFVIACMQIGDGIQGAMLGASRGMTDNRVPVLITNFAYWCLALPIGYLIAFKLDVGPNGIWLGYAFGLALAGALLTWRFFLMAGRRQALAAQVLAAQALATSTEPTE